jgi:hypothetical protein
MTDALKDFVPFDLALDLKKLEFHEPCFYVKKILNPEFFYTPSDYDDYPEQKEKEVLIPTYSQAFRWFRENHNIHSYIEWFDDGKFDYTLTSAKFEEEVCYDDGPFDTEQEAQNACLKRLINEVE